MRSFIVLLFLALSCRPAAAQFLLGAEAGPDSFLRSEDAKLDSLSDDSFAWALSAQISSSTLYSVFESTSGEKEILRYLRSGFYRQELITLILISQKTSAPFFKLAAELDKEGSLRLLAKKRGVDLPALFSEAAALKAEADAQTPLFIDPLTAEIRDSSGAFTAAMSTGTAGAFGPGAKP